MSWPSLSAASSGRYLIAAGTATYRFLPESAQLGQVPSAVEQIVGLFTGRLGYVRALADELGHGGIDPQVDDLRRNLSAWFAAPDRSPEDLVVVYYTGHGASEGRHHYLYGHDTTESGSLAGSALRSEDLADFIAASPVQHVLVLLDACFAGAGAGQAAARAQELSTSLRVDEQHGSGLLFVASARPKDEAEQLVFAEALTEIMLEDDSVGGSLVPYLRPDEVVEGVNRLFEGRRLQQRARLNAANVSRPAGLLPNPRYHSRRRTDFVGHWDPRARGIQPHQTSQRASYFTGRALVLDNLAAYLTGQAPDAGMRVVTGDPGSGKSAVLARLVVLSDQAWRREHLPAERERGDSASGLEGTIDLAVHARGKTLPDLTEEFATGIGIVERDPGLLVEAVRRRAERLNAVVDALDESPEAFAVARDLLRPLSALPNVRLVVGTRRRLCKPLGPARVDLDLDDPENQDEGEIEEYVGRMLLASEDPGVPTPYRGDEETAGQIAGVVAEKARGNYLIALLLSQDLIARATPVRLEALARELPETVGDAFEAFLQRFGEREQRFKELLRPLAYAQGNGLPDRLLWADLATELSGHTYGLGDIDELLTNAGDYVVEEDLAEERGAPRWAYWLFHEAFAEHLRLHQDERLAHRLIAARLARQAAGGGSAWFGADAYLRNHMATHAAKGGLLDQLLADPGYLLTADTGRLLPALAGASTAAGRSLAGVVRRAAQHLQACALEEAASYLEMQARQSELGGLADQVAQLGLRCPWATPWAQWRRPAQRQRLAPDQHITAMTLAQLPGETIAVLATDRGQLQFRRLSDGSHARDPIMAQDPTLIDLNPRDSRIHLLAAGEANGQPILVSADGFGVMRTWNLSEEPAALTVYEDRESVVSLALTEIAGIPAVVSAHRSKVRCWRWADGTQIGRPYEPGHFRHIGPCALIRLDQTDVIVASWDNEFDILTLPEPSPSDNASVWCAYPDEETAWLRGDAINEVLNATRSRDARIGALAALPIGNAGLVVFGDSEGYMWAWDLHGSQEEPELAPIGRHEHTLIPEHGITVTAVTIGDVNGQFIAASGDYWGRIRVWDVSNFPNTRLLEDFATGHKSEIRALAVTDIDGDPAVVSHSEDGTVRAWNLQLAPAESVATVDRCTAMTFAELDSVPVLLVGDMGGKVQILRVADGLPAAESFCGPWGEVAAIAVSAMSGHPIVLSGGYDGTVQVWDPANGQAIGAPYTQHEGYVTAIAVTQFEGRLIAASGGSDGQLRIWDVATLAPLGEPIKLGNSHSGHVPLGGVAFVHIDERLTVMAAADRTKIQAWDVLDRTPVGIPLIVNDALGAVTTTQVGKQPLVVFSDYAGVVRVRSFADRSVRLDLHCHRPLWCRGIAATEFDGDPVVMAGSREDQVVDIWNIHSGEQHQIDVGASILALAAGPDRRLAIGTDDGVALVQFRNSDLNPTG